MGIKGSWRRPDSTSREEQNLRDRYARGMITFLQYEIEFKELSRKGLIKRSGRIIKDTDSV